MANGLLKFTDLLAEDLVIESLHARSKEEALTDMASILVEKGYCKPSFVQAILDREAVHPSALPMEDVKIAIPHTDSEHVNTSAILFARLVEPVAFRSMGDPDDTLHVSLISMLALKEKARIGDLLETLITVYQDVALLRELRSGASRKAIYNALHASVTAYENR